MSSQRRKDSSRANGARSKGPITPEGKARACLNATTHGMCAKTTVLDCEDHATYDRYHDSYVARMRPASDVEADLVEQMVYAQWRIRRGWAVETAMLDDAVASQS